MSISQQVAEKVEQLPPALQLRVLDFATSLSTMPVGPKGADLLRFANTIDPTSIKEIREAIESECEDVDSSQW